MHVDNSPRRHAAVLSLAIIEKNDLLAELDAISAVVSIVRLRNPAQGTPEAPVYRQVTPEEASAFRLEPAYSFRKAQIAKELLELRSVEGLLVSLDLLWHAMLNPSPGLTDERYARRSDHTILRHAREAS